MQPVDNRTNRVLIVADQKDIHDDFVETLKPNDEKLATDEISAAFIVEENRNFLPEVELLHATRGEEACEILKDAKKSGQPIAVAFVDIRMPPGIDGIETIRRMRKIDRNIEIIIMTAYTDKPLSEIIEDMELLHKLLYIRKPFAREEIQQITLSLVEKWNVERELREKQKQLASEHRQLEAVLNATGDALGMCDASGRLTFANQKYEQLFELPEETLKRMSPEALRARFKERFRIPANSDVEGRRLHDDQGEMVEVRSGDQALPQGLFYRATIPVRDSGNELIGNLIVYRDVSDEVRIGQMKAEVLRLRTELKQTYSFEGMVGGSPPMQRLYSQLKQAAGSDIAVFIRGESGTGKELVARSFHYNSRRKHGPFVAINCAALPEDLIESELFGHEPGAFTGAVKRRIGAFESAGGGTMFLDEIGDMQPALQAKLLRVLQEKKVRRLGGNRTYPIDVRIISATNKDIDDAIRADVFREDLFYRLAVFPIEIPPLRDRREDIPLLANHFLKQFAGRNEKSIDGLSTEALRVLLQYDWPGNVRELENAIERAVLLETTDMLRAHNLPPRLSPPGVPPHERPAEGESLPLEEVERRAITHALESSDQNVAVAARTLGIAKSTLYRKLKKYDPPGSD